MELRVIKIDNGYGFAQVLELDTEQSIYCYSGSPNFLWAPTVEKLLALVTEACNKPVTTGSHTKRYGHSI